MIFNDEMPRIKIRLRPDPHMIADFCNSIEAPLNVRLCPDENSVTDLERLQVFEPDAAANPDTVAKSARNDPPDGAAHQIVQFSIARREAGIVFQKASRRVTAAKMPR